MRWCRRRQPAPLPKLESTRGPATSGGDGGHFANFVAAVRSRKQEDLNANILEGHYSSALGHLANISYRLGSEAPFNTKLPAFEGNAAALETLERTAEHLKTDVKLDLAKTDLRVGRRLTVDASSESIMGDEDAKALLTRTYRKPFTVPEVA